MLYIHILLITKYFFLSLTLNKAWFYKEKFVGKIRGHLANVHRQTTPVRFLRFECVITMRNFITRTPQRARVQQIFNYSL